MKRLYFLNMCPIFVRSLSNFGRSDSDMIYWKKRQFSIGYYVISCPTSSKILEWHLSVNVFCCQLTLCRSGVWIGVKVLGADPFILGTGKLLWIFPIKQKCHMTAAFLHNQNFSIWSSLDLFLPMCSRPDVQISCKMDYQNNWLVLNNFIMKKSSRDIQFLLNWKDSTQFSGT